MGQAKPCERQTVPRPVSASYSFGSLSLGFMSFVKTHMLKNVADVGGYTRGTVFH